MFGQSFHFCNRKYTELSPLSPPQRNFIFSFIFIHLFFVAFTTAISSRYNKNNAGKSMSSTQLLTLYNNNSSSKNQNNNCWLGFSCFLMPHCHHICCHYLDMCIYMLMYIWGSYIWYCMYRAHNCCQCEWVENGGCCRRQAIKMEKHVCGEAKKIMKYTGNALRRNSMVHYNKM